MTTVLKQLAWRCWLPSVAILVVGCAPQPPKGAEPATGTQAAVTRVTAAKPVRKPLRVETVQPGWIEAFESTALVPKISGYVEAIRVDLGDRVTKDQELIQLRVPELEDEYHQKQAIVEQVQAQIEQAAAGVTAAEAAVATAASRIKEAQAGVGRAEGELKRAQSEHGRMVKLVEGGSVTQKLVDETLNQLRSAEATTDEARAHVESAQTAHRESEAILAKAQADRRAVQAQLKVAEAEMARLKSLLGYASIRAPYDGVVIQRNVDTGDLVQASTSTPLMTVAQSGVVRVFVDVPESEAPLVDVGDQATVVIQALRGREIAGKITRTSWSLQAANRALRTEIDLENADNLLRAGMYVTARILLDERAEALIVPATAVVYQQGKTSVCCVVDGKIVLTPVTLGLRSAGELEVLSGLKGDELVVQARADALQAGQAVELLPPATTK